MPDKSAQACNELLTNSPRANLPMSKQRLVTLPLDSLITDLLNDSDCRNISPEIAEILNLVADNKGNYHVQFPGEDEVGIDGNPINSPKLWSLRHWKNTSERHQKIKLRGERDRELWLVKEANIKLISKHLIKLAALNPEASQCLCRQMLDKGEFGKIQCIIGPTRRLYTSSKEMP